MARSGNRSLAPPVARWEWPPVSIIVSIMAGSEGSSTDVSLIMRLGRDPSDQAAWEAFVDRYGPKIYAWGRACRLQDADAQDVTQAVLTRMAVRMRRFAYGLSRSFRGWLRALVQNACRDCLAERRHTLGAEGAGGTDEAGAILNLAAHDDLARRLEAEYDLELLEEAERRVRKRVAPHTWEAYRLTAIEGLSGAEAAARQGMKIAAVYVSRSNVTRQLKDEIEVLEARSEGPQPS
jgi:RNA polymerase sigma factor (sigma-70 family)